MDGGREGEGEPDPILSSSTDPSELLPSSEGENGGVQPFSRHLPGSVLGAQQGGQWHEETEKQRETERSRKIAIQDEVRQHTFFWISIFILSSRSRIQVAAGRGQKPEGQL